LGIATEECAELRTNKYLNKEERHYISQRLRAGDSRRQIAADLGRDRRTIDREITRGMKQHRVAGEPTSYRYDYHHAQRQADLRATAKGRQLKIENDHAGEAAIAKLIKKDNYSPAAAIYELRAQGKLKHYFCIKSYYNWVAWGIPRTGGGDPSISGGYQEMKSIPRTGGGDPNMQGSVGVELKYSPHRRG